MRDTLLYMIKILRISLLISFLVLSNDVYGLNRYFTWVDPKTNLRNRINLDDYQLFQENLLGKWENKGVVKVDKNIFNHLPSFINNNFFIYDEGERIRITIQGTGQVYEFFPSKKELIRIDNTFHSGYNFGSNLFIRNGTLYCLGGEGFWNYNPTITFFDEKLKEWEILRPKNKGPIPIVDGYQGYHEKSDVYYSGGSGLKNYLEDEKTEYVDDLFLFDFKQNEWSYVGKINPELPFKKSRGIVWTGEYFFHFSDGNIYILNPEKNEVYLYKDKTKSFREGYHQYVNKDTIVLFWSINDGPTVKLSISEIVKSSTYWGKFYTTGLNITWYYIGVLLLFIPTILYFKKRKRNSKLVNLEFTELEKRLLSKLIGLNPDEYLTTIDMNELLDTNNKTQENQRRIRFNVISEINKKINSMYGFKDGIIRTSLPEDKRLTVYKLNPEVIGKIKNLSELS